MKKTLKTLLLSLAMAVLLTALCVGAFTSAAVSDDPADSYIRQEAPYEDASLSMWFEHSFKKVLTKDITPSGMDTYSVYMAKNEIENAQFVLYSDTTKTGLTASVTSFTDKNGNEIPASIYYQMYITTTDLDVTSVWGSTEETSIIREGETPDPMVPLASIGRFQLNGGKSQAFYIRVKTAEDTPAGWYSAQLDIKNSSGQVVKTATVFCYVWDFVISEKTEFQTSIYFDKNTAYGGTYKGFFDYLLENRIVGMDIPDGLNPYNPYLRNDRVNTVRVGVSGGYMDSQTNISQYGELYSKLKNSPYWDEFKDKLYFYTVDEPMGQEQQDAVAAIGGQNSRHTVNDVIVRDQLIEEYWGDMAATCVPYHQDHPYPYYYYNRPLDTYEDYEKTDGTQVMIDTDSCRVWCPLLTAFTPKEELAKIDYANDYMTSPIRTITGQISGMYTIKNPASLLGYDYFGGFHDWDAIYGEFYDRTMSDITIKNEKYNTDTYKMWTYLAGSNNQYTYCHHLIESTGLQTKMLFWQCYQQDITGYLYYYANEWNANEIDTTVTGALTRLEWNPGITRYSDTYNIYGAGVLFYGPNHAKGLRGLTYVGTVRIELMRDGIEEYQMLKMLEDYVGEKETKDIVGKVSKNVVNYLSLPNFSVSGWESGMDEYDIMAAVRLEMGNTLEAAVAKGHCDHDFDEGEVILEATCLEVGTLRRTCRSCGITTDDIIPTLHAEGSCYEKISGNAATCETDGEEVYRCSICSNRKTVKTTAFHSDREHFVYEYNSANAHTVYCDTCNEKINVVSHLYFTEDTATCTEGGEMVDVCRYCKYSVETGEKTEAKGHNLVTKTVEPTCTEDGYSGAVCKNCDYSEAEVIPATGHDLVDVALDATCTEEGYKGTECTKCDYSDITVLPVIDHSYVDGKCENCGAEDPDYSGDAEYTLGDMDGDSKFNAKDANLLKRIV
ncbi:MAG: DUF4091 domain-containing protein, partial [Clostridia bacterium]|nr:DUF4091 domain-containing protein [Clostridia bacterium]